jgi:hypothetical protein
MQMAKNIQALIFKLKKEANMMSEKKLPLTLEQTLECVKKTLKNYRGKFKALEKYLCDSNETSKDCILSFTEEAYKHIAKYAEKIESVEKFWEEILSTLECSLWFYQAYDINDCKNALHILCEDVDCDWKELREACEWFGVDNVELKNLTPDYLATIYVAYKVEQELEDFFDSVAWKCQKKTL